MSLYEPDFVHLRSCDNCGKDKLRLHRYQGVSLCDECIDGVIKIDPISMTVDKINSSIIGMHQNILKHKEKVK